MNTFFDRTSKIILATVVLTASSSILAEDATMTRSISYKSADSIDRTERDTLLGRTELVQNDTLQASGYRLESIIQMSMAAEYSSAEITLYDAWTELISDFDYDAFYHRFSVTIDADTIYPSSYIYAKLYLSYEGGPWSLYSVSDDFHIHADSASDTITIETELADGFPSGYYDIRVDLYDADYGTRILSYGPYDDHSLAALPLEDSYHDGYSEHFFPVESELVIAASAHGHGTTGPLMLLLPLLFAFRALSIRRLTGHG